MIIISIGGGLGNQMFEYAFASKIKSVYPGCELKLDISNVSEPAHNGYELEAVFGIKEKQASTREIKKLTGLCLPGENWRLARRCYRKLGALSGKYRNTFLAQTDFTKYEERFFSLVSENSYYLYGVFANYRYFDDMREEILKTFRFPPVCEEHNLVYAGRIQQENSVSLHIRRGDYLTAGIRTPGMDYYRRAMDYIIRHGNPDAQFFVFTDDMEYAEKELRGYKNITFVKGNRGKNSFRDMQLMSLCRHNIITNSTFSFWGAYLNTGPDKVVICPNLPYTGTAELFSCDGWIVTDSGAGHVHTDNETRGGRIHKKVRKLCRK